MDRRAMNHRAGSLALLCDSQGMISEVLRNDLEMADVAPGRLFPGILDHSSQIKALHFLDEIRSQAAALDWELGVPLPDGSATLHFYGWSSGEKLFVAGAIDRQDSRKLYEEMLRINNEQTNLQRSTLKEVSQSTQQSLEERLYDDISRLNNELVSMQRELARKNAELERLNKLKNQFVGMAAHDLRNPLNAIQSFSDLLLDERGAVSPEEHKEFLTDIHNLSRYMLNMVNDLLSVSAIEAGQLNMELKQLNLAELLQKNIARNRLLAARKQIEITLETEDVPLLQLDAARIEQVLDNLLSNAVKFSDPGKKVNVRLFREEQHVVVAVADQGPGISATDREKMFKPFGRASALATAGERSTGLGLVIVKRIVEGHGATIRIESEAGKGATFHVSFPV